MLVYSMYVVPIIFIYGIITSMFAENIGFKVKKYKNTLTFLFHIVFGIGFTLPISVLEPTILNGGFFNFITINGLICSITFFAIDYVFRKKFR
ncbi:hypothetical protein [Lederbergia citrea]|uniref:Uncharacterized protein n=1 Tax=Lederbergia citrea TaxID=2833581 RepID=A0A942UHY0_9BACI|nr:hypothetical protein [Lederbergia citrea]MBS4221785.1 hypothetical protein [Lederbergia citrea]